MIFLYVLVIGISIGIINDAIRSLRIANEIRKWRKQSFEYKGGRYNKDIFIVKDGKIEFK